MAPGVEKLLVLKCCQVKVRRVTGAICPFLHHRGTVQYTPTGKKFPQKKPAIPRKLISAKIFQKNKLRHTAKINPRKNFPEKKSRNPAKINPRENFHEKKLHHTATINPREYNMVYSHEKLVKEKE